MATAVFKTEEIVLQDGTEVILKPLPIGPLRRFMTAWNESKDLKDDDDGFQVFINCAGIGLEENFRGTGKFETLKPSKEELAEGAHLSKEYRDYLENTLELDSIYKIMEIAGGIKLNDPKLMEAVMEQQAQQAAQLGKTSTS